MKIRTYPDPVLRQKAKPVSQVTAEIREILKEMSKAMYLGMGIGLAAPQVGISKQLIVIDAGEGLKCFVNPKIIQKKGSSVLEEGCLSFPGISVRVKRAAEVKVEAMDENGAPLNMTGRGLMAHVLQHEIDHLRGRLIIDYASWSQKIKLRAKLKVFEKEHLGQKVKCGVKAKCI
ncbi:MAG: peptide deformylase [Candidatus Omnitrophica bacterium]|nr:peptide deformylase [Candidatus Omnitrophota bacterium]